MSEIDPQNSEMANESIEQETRPGVLFRTETIAGDGINEPFTFRLYMDNGNDDQPVYDYTRPHLGPPNSYGRGAEIEEAFSAFVSTSAYKETVEDETTRSILETVRKERRREPNPYKRTYRLIASGKRDESGHIYGILTDDKSDVTPEQIEHIEKKVLRIGGFAMRKNQGS